MRDIFRELEHNSGWWDRHRNRFASRASTECTFDIIPSAMLPVPEEDWQIALRHQIEQIARRNSDHKRYAEVHDRTQEMDDLIVKLRGLVTKSPTEAARLHLQAMSILDETDRIIANSLRRTLSIPPPPSTKCDAIRRYFPVRNVCCRQKVPIIEMPLVNVNDTTKPCQQPTIDRCATFAEINSTDEDAVRKLSPPLSPAKWLFFGKLWTILHSYKFSKELCHTATNKKEGEQQDKTITENSTTREEDGVRSLWKTQIEFFLSVFGFMVGVGNTLKFPALVYQNGGGVFLIPYFIFLVLFGLPIVFMHLSIGQYSGLSTSGAFCKMMPIASGIGWALVILALPVSIYYNIIVAWSIHYFWFSLEGFFTRGLPWNYCHSDWPSNIPCCILDGPPQCFDQPNAIASPEAYFHYEVLNRTAPVYAIEQLPRDAAVTGLTVLNISSNYTRLSSFFLDSRLGPVQPHLALALAVAWILVFFGVFNGLGSIGWAVSVTSTLPHLLLAILLLRGVSLPGASDGLAFFLTPKIERLWSIQIWKSAAEQVFYSLGIDAGPLISMASFSRYRNNIYRDAVAVVFLNSLTSILAGMVIFSFVGFIAKTRNVPLEAILQHDPLYIAFTIYPGVTSYMDMMGPLWAALFFTMLTLSALDAEFAWMEMIVTCFMNRLQLTSRRSEIRVVIGLCSLCFIVGLPLATKGGIFIFHAIENLNANWNSFSLSLIQLIIVCFIYGIDNFLEDIGEMLRVPTRLSEMLIAKGKCVVQADWLMKTRFFFGPTGGYIRWTWCFFSPSILLLLLVASAFSYQGTTFDGHRLPLHYELIAWFTMSGPLVVVPVIATYKIVQAKRLGKPFMSVFDTSRWRHIVPEMDLDQPKHLGSNENDYWSIVDPVSRVASARQPNASRVDEVGYGTIVEIINDWAKHNEAELAGRISRDDDNITSSKHSTSLNRSKDSVTSTDSESRELALFGPPPNIIINKTSTVIHRQPIMGRMSGVTRKESTDIAQFNLTNASAVQRKPVERSSAPDRCNPRQTRPHSFSEENQRRSRLCSQKPNEVTTVRSTSLSVSPSQSSVDESSRKLSTEVYDKNANPNHSEILRSKEGSVEQSDFHESLGSISITPIDNSVHRSSSSSPVPGPSQSLQRRKRTALKRPKPIEIPPPINAL